MVFQTFALFPWLTVLQNVEAGLEAQGVGARERRERALAAIDLIGLDGFENAYPRELSGGMRQRTSIVRALIHDPPLLMMDEPFGALDALTREQMRLDLEALWLRTRKTVLFVTHSIDEAVLLSDRIVMLTNGPAATIGDVLAVDIPRPRNRVELAEDPAYVHARKAVIDFLYTRQAHVEKAAA